MAEARVFASSLGKARFSWLGKACRSQAPPLPGPRQGLADITIYHHKSAIWEWFVAPIKWLIYGGMDEVRRDKLGFGSLL